MASWLLWGGAFAALVPGVLAPESLNVKRIRCRGCSTPIPSPTRGWQACSLPLGLACAKVSLPGWQRRFLGNSAALVAVIGNAAVDNAGGSADGVRWPMWVCEMISAFYTAKRAQIEIDSPRRITGSVYHLCLAGISILPMNFYNRVALLLILLALSRRL